MNKQELLEQIPELVRKYANRQFECCKWEEEDDFLDTMEAVEQGDYEDIINSAVEEINYTLEVELDPEDEDIRSTIIDVLIECAHKTIKSYNPKDFEIEEYKNKRAW